MAEAECPATAATYLKRRGVQATVFLRMACRLSLVTEMTKHIKVRTNSKKVNLGVAQATSADRNCHVLACPGWFSTVALLARLTSHMCSACARREVCYESNAAGRWRQGATGFHTFVSVASEGLLPKTGR
eukprot:GHUV01048129.1.p1 GENE.GHUV01048129.1~~GHUV01048129.1.p1  ORF type:complete len:130 (-),score=13.14 GHUV01048129.1:60-449(-)